MGLHLFGVWGRPPEPDGIRRFLVQFWGLVALALGGVWSLITARMLLSKPALPWVLIDQTGVAVRTFRGGFETPWSEVEEASYVWVQTYWRKQRHGIALWIRPGAEERILFHGRRKASLITKWQHPHGRRVALVVPIIAMNRNARAVEDEISKHAPWVEE
jgi:hypothetical protein